MHVDASMSADRAEAGGAMPSGWWLIPSVLTGAGMWVGLFILIL